MNGTNGSQLWDTALAIQAISECKTLQGADEFVQNGLGFIASQQFIDHTFNHLKYYRHASKGAWPFSYSEYKYIH